MWRKALAVVVFDSFVVGVRSSSKSTERRFLPMSFSAETESVAESEVNSPSVRDAVVVLRENWFGVLVVVFGVSTVV